MARRGLTLLELLVVMAMIAILAGLVTAAAIGARRKANAAQCASNLRQLGVGMLLYAGDHRGLVLRAPGFLSADLPSDGAGRYHYMSWAEACARYFDSRWGQKRYGLEAFPLTKCPEHPLQQMETHFAVNAVSLDDSLQPTRTLKKVSVLSQVRNPSGVIYLADVVDRWVPMNWYSVPPDYIPKIGSLMVYSALQMPDGVYPMIPTDRHGKGLVNGLFFDGHVEAVSTKGMTLKLWDDGIR
ncbi:MAG: type II secretion system protein [Tepidisphaerales bacterium]